MSNLQEFSKWLNVEKFQKKMKGIKLYEIVYNVDIVKNHIEDGSPHGWLQF